MPLLDRIRMEWSGARGTPGVSTFYAISGAAVITDLNGALTVLAPYIPAGVQIQMIETGDTIDVVTGEIRATWSGVRPIPTAGGGPAAYSGPAGGMVDWRSPVYISGRRLRGRTFLVPLSTNAYSDQGGMAIGLFDALNSALASLLSAHPGELHIYQRPRPASPSWTDVRGRTHPAIAARVGGSAPITAASMSTESVVLRSRRD